MTAVSTGSGSTVGRLAARFGMSEGQLYTLVIGLVVGLATAAIGIPPTLRDRPAAVARAPLTPRTAGAPTAAVPGDTESVAPSPSARAAAPAPAAASPAPASSSAAPRTATALNATSEAQTQTTAVSGSSAPGYADGGKLGDVESLATVGSPGAASGVAVDKDGGFFVATDNGGGLGEAGPSKVIHYSSAGTVDRSYTVTGQPESHNRGLSGVVLDGDERLAVLDASTARVLRIDRDSGAHTELTTLPDLPGCTLDQTAQCEPSPLTAKPLPQAAAYLLNGDLLVADAGQGVLWSVDPFGATTIWDKSTDYTSTDIGPSGVAVEPDG